MVYIKEFFLKNFLNLLNILESNICIEKLMFFYLSFYDILH